MPKFEVSWHSNKFNVGDTETVTAASEEAVKDALKVSTKDPELVIKSIAEVS